LKLIYTWTEKDLVDTAEFIKKTLGEYGIDLQIQSINLNDLWKYISSSDKENNYDMILAWINLGYFDFNIYPYFHSSQAKLWYNFSNIKKLSLDIILEDINSNKIHKEWLDEKKNNALKIIKDEQVIKTLYTPLLNLLIDKNINNKIGKESISSWQIDRVSYLSEIYINEKKEIYYKDKWPLDFIKFLYHIITW
jgi:DNA polymerase elongation subunit (family B)